jgi:hypothetical protein
MADLESIAAWVRATCQAQGIPEKVTDLAALREVGVLLDAGMGRSRAHGAPAPST